MKTHARRTKKLAKLPKLETDYIWVSPNTELVKKGDFVPGTGVVVKRGKLFSDCFGFVNIDKKKVIRIVPLAGGTI